MRDPKRLVVLSLGAGVQSTTLALQAAEGALPRPDCAVFADTGSEPAAVYAHLDWLCEVVPFPVYRVAYGDLGHDVLRPREGRQMANPPFFTAGGGMLRRQCTQTYKVAPIQGKVRELLGLRPRQRGPREVRVEQWIGISLDEAHRMKPSRLRFIEHRWPLIEQRLHRWQCLRWLAERGYPEPPKSACWFCPYRSDAGWRGLRDHAPADFAAAVAFDRAIRGGIRGTREGLYLHRSRIPLDQVDLSTDAERGQNDLFGEECEGLCGT